MATSNTDKFIELLPAGISVDGDAVESVLLREYGSVFGAKNVTVPPTVVFMNERQVTEFQSKLKTQRHTFDELELTLQNEAMSQLIQARSAAENLGLSISPRGADSAARTYRHTIELWASRVEPGLDHWVREKRMPAEEASKIRSMSPFEQVSEIFKLEARGIYFAKDLSKSIIYSVAPPGASQHLSLLAFDVSEFDQPEIRNILSRHGWHQTVTSDLPHFTYLGTPESELADRGLKRVENAGRHFWIPDL